MWGSAATTWGLILSFLAKNFSHDELVSAAKRRSSCDELHTWKKLIEFVLQLTSASVVITKLNKKKYKKLNVISARQKWCKFQRGWNLFVIFASAFSFVSRSIIFSSSFISIEIREMWMKWSRIKAQLARLSWLQGRLTFRLVKLYSL